MMIPFLPAFVRLLCKLPIVGPLVTRVVSLVMPSLLPEGGCCPPTAWPKLEADDARELSGEMVTLGGDLEAYVSRPKNPNGAGIVVVYDVFGISGGRIRTVCDALAAKGFTVVMPDLYGEGDSIDGHGGLANIAGEESVAWLKSHSFASLQPKLDAACAFLAKEGVPAASTKLQPPFNSNRIGVVGFCWGAWVAAKLSATGRVRAAVHCHPAWKIGPWIHGEAVEEFAPKIGVPTLFIPAGDDDDGFRDGTFAKLVQGGKGRGKEVKTVDFPDMKHGWIPRGPPESAAVMKAVREALEATASFLTEQMPP